MVALKKYDLSGKEIAAVEVEDAQLEVKASSQSIKDYLVALRNNFRQRSAHTKTRAEIARTGRKPHPQKGQGRARQGDFAAPQYRGGGIVFGPRTKDIHVRMNQKERRAAIRFLLAEKVKENRVHILKADAMKEPKTKKWAAFFDKLAWSDRRVLVLGDVKKEKARENLIKSLRNLPKKEYGVITQINGYCLALAHDLIILDTAFDEFLTHLGAS